MLSANLILTNTYRYSKQQLWYCSTVDSTLQDDAGSYDLFGKTCLLGLEGGATLSSLMAYKVTLATTTKNRKTSIKQTHLEKRFLLMSYLEPS